MNDSLLGLLVLCILTCILTVGAGSIVALAVWGVRRLFFPEIPASGVRPLPFRETPASTQDTDQRGLTIYFSGRLTANDWAKIVSLHNKQTLFGVFWRVSALIGIALIALIGFSSGFFLSGEVLCYGSSFALLAVSLAIAYPFWAPRDAKGDFKKQIKKNPGAEDLSGTISEDGITFESTNVKVEFKWAMFKDMKQTPHLILLYDQNNFHHFPRGFFTSDQDWNTFRELAEHKLPSGDSRQAKRAFQYKDGIIGWVAGMLILLSVNLILPSTNPDYFLKHQSYFQYVL